MKSRFTITATRRAGWKAAFLAVGLMLATAVVVFSTGDRLKAQDNLLSIPLGFDSWTPIGPAPNVNGGTTYGEDASGRISAVAAHPAKVGLIYVAAAGGGVWKTENDGGHWRALTDTQKSLFMGAIAIAASPNPNGLDIIYAGTGEPHMGPSKLKRGNIYYGRGVLKSVDGGDNWTLLGGDIFDRKTISKIVIDPRTPDTVYVAVGPLATNGSEGNTGIWKSTDGGVLWRLITSNWAAVSDLIMDPANPDTLYAAVGEPGGDARNGVYVTVTGGEGPTPWVPAGNFPVGSPELGRITLATAPGLATDPTTLYASIAGSGKGTSLHVGELFELRKSTDGGLTWRILPQPPALCVESGQSYTYLGHGGDYHSALAVDRTNPNRVYAAGLCLTASTDGGESTEGWSVIADGDAVGPHRDHHALVFDANNKLLDGNDGGVWRLGNSGWENLNGDLQITQFVALWLNPTSANIAFGGTQDTGLMTFRGDPKWQRLLRGDSGAAAVSATTPGTVYAINRSGPSDLNYLKRSLRDGVPGSWVTKMTGIGFRAVSAFYPPVIVGVTNATPPTDRLLLGSSRVYESTDNAENWTNISSPGLNGWTATADDAITSLAIAPSDSETIYAASGGHVFVMVGRTSQGKGIWQQVDIAVVDPHFASLRVHPTKPSTAYAVRDRFGGGHVFMTTDRGLTWDDISGDLPDLPTYSIIVNSASTPETIYVGSDSGVFSSTDLGAHWVQFQSGLPNAQVIDLALTPGSPPDTPGLLAAATHGRGVWEILIPPPPPPVATGLAKHRF